MSTDKIRMGYVIASLTLSIVTGWSFSQNPMIVKADEIVIADETDAGTQETYQEIKHLVDEAVLTDCEWVEAIIEKDSVVVGNPLWFPCKDAEWNVVTTGWTDGSYVVKLYRVSANQVLHEENQNVLASFSFMIKAPEEICLEATSTLGKETKKPTVSVKLKGLDVTSDVQTVKFVFTNSKDEEVYTCEAKIDEEGTYAAEVSATKLKKKAGKYTVSAVTIDSNGNLKTIHIDEQYYVTVIVKITINASIDETITITDGTESLRDKIMQASYNLPDSIKGQI